MAASSSSYSPNNKISVANIFILIILVAPTKYAVANCFKSIISFGDSIADTGNLLNLSPPSVMAPYFASPPYGETFFHSPTGRFSDGRLIIDFIAEDIGLPFILPFHGGKDGSRRDFGGGVNFAVGGATALADQFFWEKGIFLPYANVSLVAQLSWFKEIFLPTFCQKLPAGCENFLKTSLVLVGEIGGNDYNNAFLGRKSVDLVQSFIPQVVKTISSTIKELIKLGAVTLMVPGNFPIGCSTFYLTYFRSSNEKDYDPKTGCLNWPNKFSRNHNKLLNLELNRIRKQNPNVTIIYADYYNAAMRIYRSPQKYGFAKGALEACCGGKGPYNVFLMCGIRGSKTCEDPSLYVSWDGLHLTEAAYRWIATGLIRESFTIPQLKTVCALSSKNAAGFSDH